jgi:predicted metal-dependent hydrolase
MSELDYTIKKYKRSKNIKISIHESGRVSVTGPMWVSKKAIEKFVEQKRDWIIKEVEEFKKKHNKEKTLTTQPSYHNYKARAKKLISARLKHFNEFYNFKYEKVIVKQQKTVWGSCSSQKYLNFNYKLYFLPTKMRDYIVVHELCHLKEMNHGKRFWNLVAKTIPDHKDIRKELRGLRLL